MATTVHAAFAPPFPRQPALPDTASRIRLQNSMTLPPPPANSSPRRLSYQRGPRIASPLPNWWPRPPPRSGLAASRIASPRPSQPEKPAEAASPPCSFPTRSVSAATGIGTAVANPPPSRFSSVPCPGSSGQLMPLRRTLPCRPRLPFASDGDQLVCATSICRGASDRLPGLPSASPQSALAAAVCMVPDRSPLSITGTAPSPVRQFAYVPPQQPAAPCRPDKCLMRTAASPQAA